MASAPSRKIDFLNLAPYVRYIHEASFVRGYRIPPRVIYDHEMIFLLSGECVTFIDGVEYVQKAGDILFMRPHILHSSCMRDGEPLRYYAVHFDLVYMGEQLDFSPDDVYVNLDYAHLEAIPVDEALAERPVMELSDVLFPTLIRTRDPVPYLEPFREMEALFRERPFGYHLHLRSLLLRLLGLLVKDVATKDGVSKQSPHRPLITKAIHYMHEHYAEGLDLDTLGISQELTPNYFRKLFREATGKTPLEMLTSIRLERAKLLMQEGRRTITEISEQVGYPDLHYFSKLFKKAEGMSPKYYMDSVARTGGAEIVE